MTYDGATKKTTVMAHFRIAEHDGEFIFRKMRGDQFAQDVAPDLAGSRHRQVVELLDHD